jgi:hypothetical protein
MIRDFYYLFEFITIGYEINNQVNEKITYLLVIICISKGTEINLADYFSVK